MILRGRSWALIRKVTTLVELISAHHVAVVITIMIAPCTQHHHVPMFNNLYIKCVAYLAFRNGLAPTNIKCVVGAYHEEHKFDVERQTTQLLFASLSWENNSDLMGIQCWWWWGVNQKHLGCLKLACNQHTMVQNSASDHLHLQLATMIQAETFSENCCRPCQDWHHHLRRLSTMHRCTVVLSVELRIQNAVAQTLPSWIFLLLLPVFIIISNHTSNIVGNSFRTHRNK